MERLSRLVEGERFRPIPGQKSENRLPMDPSRVYRVVRIYEQLPHTYVCEDKGGRMYTLRPETIVVRPRQRQPQPGEVRDFLLLSSKLRRASSYEMIPESMPDNLDQILMPRGVRVFRALFLTGIRNFSRAKMLEVLGSILIRSGSTISSIFSYYVKQYVKFGLIREIFPEIGVGRNEDRQRDKGSAAVD